MEQISLFGFPMLNISQNNNALSSMLRCRRFEIHSASFHEGQDFLN